MNELFEPKSIALIGASENKEKVGGVLFENLLKSNVQLYPVNPNHKKIAGKECYASVLDIKNKTDLAIIVVKAEIVKNVLEDCGKKGIKNVVIISAGFSEAGNKQGEIELKKITEKYKINVLGPNVLGFLNNNKKINASFFDGFPKNGKIGVISQSGAIGVAILDYSIKNNLGLSYFISLGNMLNIDFNKSLEYIIQDKQTEIICLYIESLKENSGKEFIELCKKAKQTGKKIIAIKAGKTNAGQKAAMSHTAALASDYHIYSGIFNQAGIIEAESLEEMLEIAETLELADGKKMGGNKACIITNAGGLGVLCSDACEENKIQVVEIPSQIKEKLSNILPGGWSKNNPVDIIGDALADRYQKTVDILDKENFFDFFIILLTPQKMTQPLETAKILTKIKKPVVTSFIGGNKITEAEKFLKQNSIKNFSDVSRLGKVLGKILGD